MKRLIMFTAFVVPVLLTACGGNPKSTETTQTEATTETPEATISNTIVITASDQMKYDLTEIKVKAGEEVTLTLKNAGTMAKEAMGHNFVLLAQGADVAAFATEAMANKASDYIPTGSKAILVHTKLLGPGESDTITFTVPAGEYEFICSFPGHYGMMRGKVIAE
ncbi:azurin [Arcticibacter svalbardensis]|nr:azurin [Arcticibacter svalbardensis]